jgi:hypothetical protein
MARSIKTVRWYELGYWTTDEEGRNVEWHVIGRYDTVALANEDQEKGQALWTHVTLLTRHKRIEVIAG